MKRHRLLVVSLAVLAAGFLGTAVAASAPRKTHAAPVDITIATANNMLHTAEFVGVEKGFFLKFGLRAKLDVLQTGAQINAEMQSGTAQFGGGSVTAIPPARQAGLHTVILAPYMNDATTETGDRALAIVGRADRGIAKGDVSSLVGKTIGLAVGGTGNEYLDRWLSKSGIDYSKVKLVNVQPGSQVSAIQQGRVDAIATWEPYQTLILNTLGSNGVVVKRGGGVLDYILGLETTDEYAAAHPDVVQAAANAIVAADAWIRDNPKQAAEIDTHWIDGLDASTAAQALHFPNFDPRVSGCTIGAFGDSTRYLIQQRQIKSTPFVSATDEIATKYVRAAQAKYPQYFRGLKPIPKRCRAHR